MSGIFLFSEDTALATQLLTPALELKRSLDQPIIALAWRKRRPETRQQAAPTPCCSCKARVAIGCTDGISGGGFLYTNRGTVSIGAVFNPEQAQRRRRHIQDIFQDFKLHPAIAPLIEDGTSVEYGAHLVPEIGYQGIPNQLSWEGIVVVGDAARFGINTGLIIRGMDLAIVSGVAAARAIIAAKAPADVGRLYQDQLEDLRLLANQRAYQNFHGILDMPRIFRAYPNLANDAMRFLFSVDGKVPTPMLKGLLQAVKRNVNLGRMAVGCWKVFRHL